jgi:hypothetical protein
VDLRVSETREWLFEDPGKTGDVRRMPTNVDRAQSATAKHEVVPAKALSISDIVASSVALR